MKFTINGVEYNATRLNVLALTNDLGDIVKETLIKDAIAMASHMEVGSEKSHFLSNAYRHLPSGSALMDKIQDYLQSFDGYKWVLNHVCDEPIELDADTLEDFIPIIEYALGVETSEDGGDQDTPPLELETKLKASPKMDY